MLLKSITDFVIIIITCLILLTYSLYMISSASMTMDTMSSHTWIWIIGLILAIVCLMVIPIMLFIYVCYDRLIPCHRLLCEANHLQILI